MDTPLTIHNLKCTPVLVPLANPIRTASGNVSHAPLVLLDLMTEEGITGHAYLFTYTPLVLKSVCTLIEELTPLMCVTPTARYLEVLDIAGPILAEPLRLENGNALPSELPGNGNHRNSEAIAEYVTS